MAYRSSSNANAKAASMVGILPTGTEVGDRLLAFVTFDYATNTISSGAAGWSLLAQNSITSPDGHTCTLWEIKSYVGTEGLTWTVPAAVDHIIDIVSMTGRHTSAASIIQATTNTTGNNTPISCAFTGLTASSGDDVILFASLDKINGTDVWSFTSSPSGYTERQDTDRTWVTASTHTADNQSGVTGTLTTTATRTSGSVNAGYLGYVVAVPISGGSQTLTPAIYVNTNTFYAPTVTPGDVGLIPSLFVDSDTFFIPNAVATYSLLPTLYSDSDIFFSPTISETYALLPGLYSDSDTFYTHTISGAGAPQNITPGLFSNSSSFYTQTVIAGTVNLTPSLYVDTDTFYSHVVATAGALFPALYVDSDTFFTQTVIPGQVSLTASLFVDSDTFYSHIVSSGGSVLQPGLYSNTNIFYAQSLSKFNDLIPSLFIDSDSFYNHDVSVGSVNLSASIYVNFDTFYQHLMLTGELIGLVSNPSVIITTKTRTIILN